MFKGCYEVSNLILFSSVGWKCRFPCLVSCHQTQQILSTGWEWFWRQIEVWSVFQDGFFFGLDQNVFGVVLTLHSILMKIETEIEREKSFYILCKIIIQCGIGKGTTLDKISLWLAVCNLLYIQKLRSILEGKGLGKRQLLITCITAVTIFCIYFKHSDSCFKPYYTRVVVFWVTSLSLSHRRLKFMIVCINFSFL